MLAEEVPAGAHTHKHLANEATAAAAADKRRGSGSSRSGKSGLTAGASEVEETL